jgi:hypothetical protein
LQAEIVTADGGVLVVNACNHPDLFWAVKGGGGGAFGVLTKLTLRTRELPTTFGAAFGTIRARSDTAFRELIVELSRSMRTSCLIRIGESRSPSAKTMRCVSRWCSRGSSSPRPRACGRLSRRR